MHDEWFLSFTTTLPLFGHFFIEGEICLQLLKPGVLGVDFNLFLWHELSINVERFLDLLGCLAFEHGCHLHGLKATKI